MVEPKELFAEFERLTNVYEESEGGKSLVEWFRQDWALFGNSKMDNAHAKELLGEILDDGDIVRRRFRPSPEYVSHNLPQWDNLRDEIKHKNRWFFTESIDMDRFGQLLDFLIISDLGESWYRARLNVKSSPFALDEMGAPPHELASHGRANPVGIPYLYLGSDPETAISETRPHTGDTASVAKFSVPNIKVVDLRNPREQVSPFLLSDSSDIGQLRVDIPLLEKLGEELSRPVLPTAAAFEYIPSQYLCEFMKKLGFDGVVYRSSVGRGINLAMFQPQLVTSVSVSLYKVDRVSAVISES
ncbi:RES family NAD+ phosphorylase [Arthrobacter sp. TWP1-1]|uniref:RES family NAD+ phosphorylase n=1 Tax=Arthrobacter sp. TWP1-1 TaxID=2804568 RepID=UPI003CFB866E